MPLTALPSLNRAVRRGWDQVTMREERRTCILRDLDIDQTNTFSGDTAEASSSVQALETSLMSIHFLPC